MKDVYHLSHGIVAVIALLTGTYISFAKKGTKLHKKIGYLYVITMLITIFSSFGIVELYNGFGVYHVMALISLISISIGMYFPLFKRNNSDWVIHHYYWMLYSFIGLLMALGSHCIMFLPIEWSFWTKGLIVWGIPYITGTVLINTYKKEVEKEFILKREEQGN